MHGGISPSLDSLDNIRQLDRIQEVGNGSHGSLRELFSSAPDCRRCPTRAPCRSATALLLMTPQLTGVTVHAGATFCGQILMTGAVGASRHAVPFFEKTGDSSLTCSADVESLAFPRPRWLIRTGAGYTFGQDISEQFLGLSLTSDLRPSVVA